MIEGERGDLARRLAAYVEGDVVGAAQVQLERQLAESSSTRATLEDMNRVRAALAAPIAALDGVDLRRDLHAALAAERATSAPRRARPRVWLAGLAACFGLSVVLRGEPAHEPTDVRAKSARTSTEDARQRWTFVRAFRVRPGMQPEPLAGTLNVGDGLLFSYTHDRSDGLAALLIFAVDAGGRIHWYHPAWLAPADDPRSIPIASGVRQRLLPEVIEHDYQPGPLRLYALFTRAPLRVSEVDAWLRAEGLRPTRAPVSEAKLQVHAVTVEP